MIYRESRVAVVGLGYVGLPLLVHLAENSASVVGYDVKLELIQSLSLGKSHIPDVSSDSLKHLIDLGKAKFSTNPETLSDCDVIVVCVPTPLDIQQGIDLSALDYASQAVATYAREGSLIISESTSYPGTLREIFGSRLSKQRAGENFYLATAPERMDPGSGFHIRRIPRVVSGINPESTMRAAEFYKNHFDIVTTVSTPEVAEMSKLLENTFRQVNISLINEINQLCREAGINTREVIDAAGTKPYGFMKFFPSAGIGGHCIPVDPEYLQHFAMKFGDPLKIVSAATNVNLELGKSIVNRIEKLSTSKQFVSGLILGVSYKANVPDVRDTPANGIIEAMMDLNIKARWHDPLVKIWRGESSTPLRSDSWDFGVVVTAHDDLDINAAKKSCKVIFDCTGRYSFDPEIVQI
jgi:UDP-N-acetyl-D-glucosamine dehydrogenase